MSKPKESKSSPVLVTALIVILAALAAMVALLLILTQKQEPEVQPPSSFVAVTVTEAGYTYEQRSYTLDAMRPLLSALPDDTGVQITQEGDSREALNALTEALREEGIPYEVQASFWLQSDS